jgi:O-antigen/teichoic acid export membrane protein
MQAVNDRLSLEGRTLRAHAARGTIVNGAFLAGVYSLTLLRGFVIAAFLTVSEYAVWGIVLVAVYVVIGLKQTGIGEKYVQQSESSDEEAFQKAFTLELAFTGVLVALIAVAMPLLALAYGQEEILAPGLVLALAPLAGALQAPVWVFYRRMEFVRQRRLQAVDPVVAFALTVGLAAAGAGFWAPVVGTVAGAAAGAAVALRACPYRLALRWDREALRDYFGFSWPIFVAALTPLVMAQGSMLAGEHAVGLAAAGIIVLAATISDYANRVDSILTETLYPAICAVRDRGDLLAEAFLKSNRLALMWGIPFGVGVALFASDLVEFGIGERWREGVGLIQAFGLIAAANHVAFNWDAFYRAQGRTRPIAVWSLAILVAFVAVALPLLVTEGLDGFAIGMGATTAVSLVVRSFYLRRMFPGVALARHAARAIAPAVPATLAVLALRTAQTGERTAGLALGELGLFLAVAVAATVAAERPLLREVVGYLRGRPAQPGVAT